MTDRDLNSPTFSHLLTVINFSLSRSLALARSLSLTPPSSSSSYFLLLPPEATRAPVHDATTARERKCIKRHQITQYMLYITQYMFCLSVKLSLSRASCACTTTWPSRLLPRLPSSCFLSLTLSLSVCLLPFSDAQKLMAYAW